VSGIRIGLKARRLHFLHATMGGQPPDGTRVGHYRIRYVSGRTEELPILYGHHASTGGYRVNLAAHEWTRLLMRQRSGQSRLRS
jgi:hypothetical protein